MESGYLICCYVPSTHLEPVKSALFQAGAGQLGHYDQCCWQIRGQGQFRPQAKANPSIGKPLELTVIEEYKIEIICRAQVLEQCILALKEAHPYEEPAYQVLEFKAL